MKGKLVSIITPSFNQAKYLEETILSVINQDYENIEYIIIDGGSNDESTEIIKKYENHLAYWISEKDKGQADAINKGIRRAKGEYICWVNSDDILYPDFISRRMSEFKRFPESDFIYGDVNQGKDETRSIIRKGRQTDFLKMLRTTEVPIPQQSSIWRKSVTEKVGLLEEKWHVLLDRAYFMEVARNCKIKYIPGAVAFFRNHDRSKSIAEAMRWVDEMPEYYKKLFESDALKKYKNNRKETMTNVYFFCALVAKESRSEKEREFIEKAKNESKLHYYKHKYFKPINDRINLLADLMS